MCKSCVEEGKMTQEEFELEEKNSLDLAFKICELLKGQTQEVVINVLLNCLISVTNEMKVPPGEVVLALITGFGMSMVSYSPKENKEVRH